MIRNFFPCSMSCATYSRNRENGGLVTTMSACLRNATHSELRKSPPGYLSGSPLSGMRDLPHEWWALDRTGIMPVEGAQHGKEGLLAAVQGRGVQAGYRSRLRRGPRGPGAGGSVQHPGVLAPQARASP